MKRFMVLSVLLTSVAFAQTNVAVGSKKFTESYVLGEMAKGLLTEAGFATEHKQGMGGTIILWEALKGGGIQAYPEYTGTISEEILKLKGHVGIDQLRSELAKQGVGMTGELGFNNTYALVMTKERAGQLGISKISDLKAHPELKVGVSHEFLERKDGWKPLTARYALAMPDVKGIDHSLAYAALKSGAIEITDAYSTDAKIAEDNLLVLDDDLGYFPQYKAVFLYRKELPEKAVSALASMEGTLNESRMTALNAEAERTKDYAAAAQRYLTEQAKTAVAAVPTESIAAKIVRLTLQHLRLVGLSMLFAILVGIPLGIWASRPGVFSQLILGVTGIIQTIPSLALLALLVPISFLGISTTTAVVALFLYSLLPIVRGVASGLQDIPIGIRESAAALGLEPSARLTKVFLPMASRSILSGIKTSAVINVGTATLAALIGAGGLGEPIVSGLNLNDTGLIMQGAIPAAVLAIFVTLLFDLLDRVLISKGLRIRSQTA